MRQTLQDSSRYRRFVDDRDRALERIHQNAQIDLSRLLFEALDQIEGLAAQLSLKAESPFGGKHQLSQLFDQGVQKILGALLPALLKRQLSLRKAAFVLTYASELEAIGRATQKNAFQDPIGRDEFKLHVSNALQSDTLMGKLENRIWLAILHLHQRLTKAFFMALLGEKKPAEIVAAVKRAFPDAEVYYRPPRELSKLKESANGKQKESWFDLDFIDEGDWDWAVQAYKDTELPPNRFDKSASWDPEKGLMRYAWEGEQEATEDFVRAVRAGQVQAGKDLGITEFVWVAIIDDKTCEECCLPRNGKTSKEIEAEFGGDECDANVPPAHFNCRCQVAPVASEDEVQGPDWESFNDWLES